jgi:hypothetical protein
VFVRDCSSLGDSIYDVFAELGHQEPVAGPIYLYSFISLFIYAVLNIFIAIVEDGNKL